MDAQLITTIGTIGQSGPHAQITRAAANFRPTGKLSFLARKSGAVGLIISRNVGANARVASLVTNPRCAITEIST
jgi:hypothetical protein